MKKFDHRAKSHAFLPYTNKSYTHYNPHLVLSGEEILLINDEGFRYLGVVIEPSLQENKLRQAIVTSLKKWPEIINLASVSNTTKL